MLQLVMASLLNLPTELRDEIWCLLTPSQEQPTNGHAAADKSPRASFKQRPYSALASTCQQLKLEIASRIYVKVHLKATHPNEALEWLATVTPRNSIWIQHLVIQASTVGVSESEDLMARECAWAFALRCMPKLQSLIFHFANDRKINPLPSNNEYDIEDRNPGLLEQLASSAYAYSQEVPSTDLRSNLHSKWTFQPSLRSFPFNHAFISLGETLPEILVQYFNQSLYSPSTRNTTSATRSPANSHANDSMEMSITGLHPTFFTENDLYLADTSVFNTNNEDFNALLTFKRLPQHTTTSPTQLLQNMLHDLPHLQYLRIGCRNVDSSFLTHLPRHLHTIDVAFTDEDPNRVAENLMTMRGLCRKLFTLAVAVSPLHDRDCVGEDKKREVFFDRRFVDSNVQEKWEPFWRALDEIRDSKVKVWEGEGPGFKRGRKV